MVSTKVDEHISFTQWHSVRGSQWGCTRRGRLEGEALHNMTLERRSGKTEGAWNSPEESPGGKWALNRSTGPKHNPLKGEVDKDWAPTKEGGACEKGTWLPPLT